MITQTVSQMLKEYAVLHNTPMTVGERFTNAGQDKLDREVELLKILANSYGIEPFDFVMKFERGQIK